MNLVELRHVIKMKLMEILKVFVDVALVVAQSTQKYSVRDSDVIYS